MWCGAEIFIAPLNRHENSVDLLKFSSLMFSYVCVLLVGQIFHDFPQNCGYRKIKAQCFFHVCSYPALYWHCTRQMNIALGK